MNTSNLSTYLENEVYSASAGKLVLMLYDGAINFLRRLDGLDYKSDLEKKSYNINKAYAILSELQMSLDMKYTEISTNLFSLYGYMQKTLLEGNLQNNPDKINEVVRMLTDLRETWAQVIKQEEQKQIAQMPATKLASTNDDDTPSFSLAG